MSPATTASGASRRSSRIMPGGPATSPPAWVATSSRWCWRTPDTRPPAASRASCARRSRTSGCASIPAPRSPSAWAPRRASRRRRPRRRRCSHWRTGRSTRPSARGATGWSSCAFRAAPPVAPAAVAARGPRSCPDRFAYTAGATPARERPTMNHAQHATRHGRRRFAAACLVAGAFGARAARPAIAASASRDPDGALLARVIEGAHRRPEARSRDAARHPFETLRFFGIRPDMTVVEIAPGAGWYTEILAPYLREHGRLYAAHYARDAGSDYQRRSRERFDAKLAADPALYDRVVVGEQPDPGHGFRGIAPPGGADMVLTFRNL